MIYRTNVQQTGIIQKTLSGKTTNKIKYANKQHIIPININQ